MCNLISRLWYDDVGSVVAGEWVFVATILVLGAVSGMAALRKAAPDDFDDSPAASAPQHPGATPAAVKDAR